MQEQKEPPCADSAARGRGGGAKGRKRRTDLKLLQAELRSSTGRWWRCEVHGARTKHRQVLHQIVIFDAGGSPGSDDRQAEEQVHAR